MAVSAIPKGRGVWCQHASHSGAGCAIYANRPAPCRDWSCVWASGHPALLEADRPDKTGVVANRDGARQISLHESRSGALEGVAELVNRLVAAGETVSLIPVAGRPTAVGAEADEARRRLARLEKLRR